MKKNLVLKNNKSIKEPLKRNRWIWPISVLLSNRLFANDLSFLILAFFYTIFLASQNAAPVKQIEPIFHTVPPRPMRLLHSETYIRYTYTEKYYMFFIWRKKRFLFWFLFQYYIGNFFCKFIGTLRALQRIRALWAIGIGNWKLPKKA